MSAAQIPRFRDATVFGLHQLYAWRIVMYGGSVPGIDLASIDPQVTPERQSPSLDRVNSKNHLGTSKSRWKFAGLCVVVGMCVIFIGNQYSEHKRSQSADNCLNCMEKAPSIEPSSEVVEKIAGTAAKPLQSMSFGAHGGLRSLTAYPKIQRKPMRIGSRHHDAVEHARRWHDTLHSIGVAKRASVFFGNYAELSVRQSVSEQDATTVTHVGSHQINWNDRMIQRRITDDPSAFLAHSR